jgi:TolB-like protein/cytochrome c-type biogenesis protein CcmH/NrfG
VNQESSNQIVTGSDVFVSYASQDASVANSIVESLEAHGLKCWMAPRDVRPGTQYADAIVRAINEAKAVVLVMSGSAVGSSHVGKEIERASSKRKPIIAFRMDAAPLNHALEYFLSESQWIDVKALGMPAALAKLNEAVGQGSGISAAGIPPAPRNRAKGGRVAIAAAVVVTLGVAVGLGLYFWKSNHREAQAPPLAAITDKSIAVLPFVDMSEKKDQEYFSDGLSEELIDMLTRVPELRVPARTSSFYFKGKQMTIANIAKELGVANVLEGSVRKNGRTIRITAQLIRADTSYHIWSQTYDRELDDIFKVQDEIAAAVVSALRASLAINAVRGTPKPLNADSYTLLMQAQFFLLRNTVEDQEKAFQYFQRAVDSDPKSATAWAGLSRATANLWGNGVLPWQKAFDDAQQWAERAVALEPQLAEAHIALGKVYLNMSQDYAAAKQEFDMARSLDPEDAVVLFWSADSALASGNLASAMQFLRRAVLKDPLDGEIYSLLGQTYYYAGRFVEAEDSYRKALDLIPARAGLRSSLGFALLAKGEHEEGLQEIRREIGAGERDTSLALAYQILGRMAEARSALTQLEAARGQSDAFSIAQIYALRGDRERTFQCLDRAYQQHEYFMHIKADPWFDNARGDPRYKALLKKMSLPE